MIDQHSSAYAFQHYKERARQLITTNAFSTVCEIGGGRSPLFTDKEIAELRLEYTILDISEDELAAAPSYCLKVRGDICVRDPGARSGQYDFMFSRLVAEHVSSASAMHRNIFQLLQPGGLAFHFFPTLFTPAFVVNRVLPEHVAQRLLLAFWPSRRTIHQKFPARYSKCFGPTSPMKRFIRNLGYEVEEYRAFYGTGYLARIPVLRSVESFISVTAARRLGPWFSSYAWLLVRKPPSVKTVRKDSWRAASANSGQVVSHNR